MTKSIPVVTQHKHATRKQQAALKALIEESRSRVPREDPPTSYVRARSITSGPMGPVLAAIRLTAIRHSGSEKEHSLLALGAALVQIEEEIQFEGENRELVRDENTNLVAEEVKDSMCSKIPFVEMLFEEVQRVDGESLRCLLEYIGDVVRVFDRELERRNREVAKDGGGDGKVKMEERDGNVDDAVAWREPRWQR